MGVFGHVIFNWHNTIVKAFNLSSIYVDLSQFLISTNFEEERYASQFIKGIIKYNLNVMYTFEKTSI